MNSLTYTTNNTINITTNYTTNITTLSYEMVDMMGDIGYLIFPVITIIFIVVIISFFSTIIHNIIKFSCGTKALGKTYMDIAHKIQKNQNKTRNQNKIDKKTFTEKQKEFEDKRKRFYNKLK